MINHDRDAYKIQCPCGATTWVNGTYEEDVNHLSLNEPDDEWEGGDEGCQHETYEVVDHQYPSWDD